jgi:CRISPR type III-A-associated protein Csm2
LRKCRDCGKEFIPKDARHQTCWDCFKSKQDSSTAKSGAGGIAHGSPRAEFPANYLLAAYFDDKGYLFPELVTTHAEHIADSLGVGGVTSTQLRRFYTKAKSIEQRLDAGERFGATVPNILELKQHAAYAAGRAQGHAEQQGLETFKRFIDMNVDLAVSGEKAFRKGFLLHFQGVVAFFKYRHPKK